MRTFLLGLWLGCLVPVIFALAYSGGTFRRNTRLSGASAMHGLFGGDIGNPPEQALDNELFLQQAVQESMGETALSKIALSKSGNSEVQSFARQLLIDQQEMAGQLRQLAQFTSEPLPTVLDSRHSEQVRFVQDLPTADFDSTYIELLDQDYRATVSLFNQASETPKLEPRLQDFAEEFLPRLAHRHHQLRRLQLRFS